MAYKPKWESTRAGQFVDNPDPLGDTSTKIRQLILETGDRDDKQRDFNAYVDKAIDLIHRRWKEIDKANIVEKVLGHGWQIKGLWLVVTGLILAVFELYRKHL